MAWDPKAHPRYPAGTAGGLGGKFMPAHLAGSAQWASAISAQIGAGRAGMRGGFPAETPTERAGRVHSLMQQHLHLRTVVAHKPNGRWDSARARQHQLIIDAIMRRHAKVPTDRKAIVLGGLPGSGKTSTIRAAGGVHTSDYITVNPDDMKEELARRGMIPDIPGHPDLSPLERSTLIHEESVHLADMLAQRAYRRGKNVIWDFTMGDPNASQRRVQDLRSHGYRVGGIFVDVPVDTALAREAKRYARDQADWEAGKGHGGRPVPPWLITNQRLGRSSHNRQIFDSMHSQFDEWRVYDNSGSAPRLVAKS